MSMILKEVYDAFLAAGVTEEQASKAAAALAQIIPADINARLSALEAKMTMLQWMVGLNFAATLGILFKIIF